MRLFVFITLLFVLMPSVKAEVLQPNEYNIDYFDGEVSGTTHPAGYSTYEKWYRHDGIDSL